MIVDEKYILVHAGLNVEITDPLEDTNAMIWGGGNRLSSNHLFLQDKYIIHGHYVKSQGEIKYSISEKTQFIGIDNGVFMNVPGYGKLLAFDFVNWEIHFQKNLDN